MIDEKDSFTDSKSDKKNKVSKFLKWFMKTLILVAVGIIGYILYNWIISSGGIAKTIGSVLGSSAAVVNTAAVSNASNSGIELSNLSKKSSTDANTLTGVGGVGEGGVGAGEVGEGLTPSANELNTLSSDTEKRSKKAFEEMSRVRN